MSSSGEDGAADSEEMTAEAETSGKTSCGCARTALVLLTDTLGQIAWRTRSFA